MKSRQRAPAFSLVELSIVLVILGLLVGSVMVGRALISAAQIRSLNTQTVEVATAVNTFRDKYMNVPGEFLLYKSAWPQLVGSYCPKPTNTALTNSNGLIDNSFENEAAFAELYAAGLVPNGSPQILQDGTVRATWDCYENNMQQAAAFYTKFDGVLATFGGNRTTGNVAEGAPGGLNSLTYGNTWVPVLTVEAALAFDAKFDDGMPYLGRILAERTHTNYCTSTQAPGGTYNSATMNALACYISIGFP